MLAMPIKKRRWVISGVLTLVVAGYLGWYYSKILTSDDIVLVPLALTERFGSIARHIADFELNQRVESGEANGADVLNAILGLAYSGAFDTDKVLEKADYLLNNGIDINSHSSFGVTPLHTAIMMNEPEVVSYLLERCADPGVPTSFGHDPTGQVNAIEFAFFMEKEKPHMDFSRIFELLESRNIQIGCK